MNNLFENGLARMYGPHFLMLFAVAAIIVMLFAWWIIHSADHSLEQGPFTGPDSPNPFEIAYLRGGAAETARLVILSLFQKGYLDVSHRVSAKGKQVDLRTKDVQGETAALEPVERTAFDVLARSGDGYLRSGEVVTHAVEQYCEPLKQELLDLDLLASGRLRATVLFAQLIGCGVLLGLGGYKLAAALLSGRQNVFSLVLMLLGALIVLCRVTRAPWTSARGNLYLKSLAERFRPEADWVKESQPVEQAVMLSAVGIFGVGLLQDTGYSVVGEAFRNQEQEAAAFSAQTNGGGCGGGCGGGGCGGCGCGG